MCFRVRRTRSKDGMVHAWNCHGLIKRSKDFRCALPYSLRSKFPEDTMRLVHRSAESKVLRRNAHMEDPTQLTEVLSMSISHNLNLPEPEMKVRKTEEGKNGE